MLHTEDSSVNSIPVFTRHPIPPDKLAAFARMRDRFHDRSEAMGNIRLNDGTWHRPQDLLEDAYPTVERVPARQFEDDILPF